MRTPATPLLSRELTNERISMPYPHVKALVVSEALALVVTSLPKGDLPVLCEHKGTLRQVASIKYSAPCINQLRKVSPLLFVKDANVSQELNSVIDVMEVL